VTSELISFIENAIKEQGLPYLVVPQDSGFELKLSTADAEYLERVSATEAFTLTTVVTVKGDNKPTVHMVEEIHELKRDETGDYSIGEELAPADAIGAVESETVSTDDEWKLFKARRWLVSILEFKGYKLKEPVKEKSKAVLIIVAVVILVALLAAAFSGIASSADGGAFAGQEEVIDKREGVSSDQVLGSFYK
jgi:hypothetical protein